MCVRIRIALASSTRLLHLPTVSGRGSVRCVTGSWMKPVKWCHRTVAHGTGSTTYRAPQHTVCWMFYAYLLCSCPSTTASHHHPILLIIDSLNIPNNDKKIESIYTNRRYIYIYIWKYIHKFMGKQKSFDMLW